MVLKKKFKIGARAIGSGRTFIIAEVGSNHNQRMETAKKLIDCASECGADAVKFQSIKYEELYMPGRDNADKKTLFKRIKLEESWHGELCDYCRKKEILFLSAPTYLRAVDLIKEAGAVAYKIASPQTAAFPQLIRRVAELKRPVIMSTGYCRPAEIKRAVRLVRKTGNTRLALLHCVSEYPTRAELVNLNFIKTLKRIYGIPVGFSDHTLGYEITLAAVAAGADIIEKHVTLFRKQKGPDHFFALEPRDFGRMTEAIRRVESAMGRGIKNRITKKEAILLREVKMRAVAKENIPAGAAIDKTRDILFRRDTEGFDAWKIYGAGALTARINIRKNEPIKPRHVFAS